MSTKVIDPIESRDNLPVDPTPTPCKMRRDSPTLFNSTHLTSPMGDSSWMPEDPSEKSFRMVEVEPTT